jgi:hypothetical protein
MKITHKATLTDTPPTRIKVKGKTYYLSASDATRLTLSGLLRYYVWSGNQLQRPAQWS